MNKRQYKKVLLFAAVASICGQAPDALTMIPVSSTQSADGLKPAPRGDSGLSPRRGSDASATGSGSDSVVGPLVPASSGVVSAPQAARWSKTRTFGVSAFASALVLLGKTVHQANAQRVTRGASSLAPKKLLSKQGLKDFGTSFGAVSKDKWFQLKEVFAPAPTKGSGEKPATRFARAHTFLKANPEVKLALGVLLAPTVIHLVIEKAFFGKKKNCKGDENQQEGVVHQILSEEQAQVIIAELTSPPSAEIALLDDASVKEGERRLVDALQGAGKGSSASAGDSDFQSAVTTVPASSATAVVALAAPRSATSPAVPPSEVATAAPMVVSSAAPTTTTAVTPVDQVPAVSAMVSASFSQIQDTKTPPSTAGAVNHEPPIIPDHSFVGVSSSYRLSLTPSVNALKQATNALKQATNFFQTRRGPGDASVSASASSGVAADVSQQSRPNVSFEDIAREGGDAPEVDEELESPVASRVASPLPDATLGVDAVASVSPQHVRLNAILAGRNGAYVPAQGQSAPETVSAVPASATGASVPFMASADDAVEWGEWQSAPPATGAPAPEVSVSNFRLSHVDGLEGQAPRLLFAVTAEHNPAVLVKPPQKPNSFIASQESFSTDTRQQMIVEQPTSRGSFEPSGFMFSGEARFNLFATTAQAKAHEVSQTPVVSLHAVNSSGKTFRGVEDDLKDEMVTPAQPVQQSTASVEPVVPVVSASTEVSSATATPASAQQSTVLLTSSLPPKAPSRPSSATSGLQGSAKPLVVDRDRSASPASLHGPVAPPADPSGNVGHGSVPRGPSPVPRPQGETVRFVTNSAFYPATRGGVGSFTGRPSPIIDKLSTQSSALAQQEPVVVQNEVAAPDVVRPVAQMQPRFVASSAPRAPRMGATSDASRFRSTSATASASAGLTAPHATNSRGRPTHSPKAPQIPIYGSRENPYRLQNGEKMLNPGFYKLPNGCLLELYRDASGRLVPRNKK